MFSAGSNLYSELWFRFFHNGIDEARTAREVDFICACAPLPHFRRVLDLCCGTGRHARVLSSRGYAVTGIDRDHGAVATARSLAGGVQYVVRDIQEYRPEVDAFNVIIVMSQSFGYFDATTNRDLFRALATGLEHGGRVVLDLWNPEFFNIHQGERDLESTYGAVHETKRVKNGRLFVELEYPNGAVDAFEWQLFSPTQMMALADSVDLALTVACTDFHMTTEIDPAKPKIQFVLERP